MDLEVVVEEVEGVAVVAGEAMAVGETKVVTLEVAEVVAEVVVEEVIEVAGVEVEVVEEVVSKAEAEEALVASQVAGINHSAPIPRRDSLSASC